MSDEEEVTFIECVRVEEGNYMFPLQQEGTPQRRLPQEQEEEKQEEGFTHCREHDDRGRM